MLNAVAGLAGGYENRYIGRNLQFSYDRVLRVGPPGPALFYYLNVAGSVEGADRVQAMRKPDRFRGRKERQTSNVRPTESGRF